MVTMEEAVSKARKFLVYQAGILNVFLYLEELNLEHGRWTVRFRRENIFSQVIGRYIVEVDDQRGDVVGFREIKSDK